MLWHNENRNNEEISNHATETCPYSSIDTVHRILTKLARSRTLSARQAERAIIFMFCAEGLNNLQISERVSIGQDSVSK